MSRALMALVAATVLMPVAARAETNPQSTTTYDSAEQFNTGMKPSVGVMGDVGVNKYDRHLATSTDVGVAYGVRADLSPTRNVGIELAYEGALNNLASQFSTDGRLLTNQIGGDLRLNLVPPTHDLPGHLKPFLFGGVAYQRITTQNFTPGFADANAIAVPIGAGLEADIGDRFIVGARYTYNFLFNEANSFGGNTDSWAAVATLGARISK